jgi:hypothetical protein
MNSLFGDISNIISLAITPAFLLLGVMMQMRVMSNRLERVVDRSRILESRLGKDSGLYNAITHELSLLNRRMDVIHKATGFSTLCMILICSVVVVLFADDAFNLRLDSLIAFLFVFAMLLLIASFSLFLHEIFIASHSLPATALHGNRHRQDPDAGGH